jgi:hypothetical protein
MNNFFTAENRDKKRPPVEQKEEEVGELLRANNHRRQKELIKYETHYPVKPPTMQVFFPLKA